MEASLGVETRPTMTPLQKLDKPLCFFENVETYNVVFRADRSPRLEVRYAIRITSMGSIWGGVTLGRVFTF
jgi:hypothetical protein